MRDEQKTKKELIIELQQLRDQISELNSPKKTEDTGSEDREKSNFRALFDLLPLSVYRIDQEGMVTFANRCSLELFGYTEKEIEAGISFYEVLIPEDRERASRVFQCILRGQQTYGEEYTALRKQGESFPIGVYASPLVQRGCRVGVIGIAVDMARCRLAEEKLKLSKHRYKKTLDSMVDAIHVVDTDLRVVLFNSSFQRWAEQLGLISQEYEVIGRGVRELFPFLPESVIREYQHVFETGEVLVTEEKNIVKGQELVTATWKVPVWENGKVIQVITIIRNITERKKIESALRASEERYRMLFNRCNDPVFLYSLSEDGQFGKFLEVNDLACKVLGYTHAEMLEMSPSDLIDLNKASQVGDIIGSLFSEGHVLFEVDHIAKDGRRIPAEINAHLFRLEGKQMVLSVARDITERKKAGEALRESEARYRAIVEDQTELVCRFRGDWTLSFVNEAYCRYFGKRREELIGQIFMPLVHKEDRGDLDRQISSLCPERPIAVSEHRVITADRGVRWQQWINRALFDDQGHLKEYQSVGRDVTEQKQMEEEVRVAKSALEKQNIELKKLDKIKDNLIRDVSHELKTPVAKHAMQLELLNRNLRGKGISHEVQSALNVMRASVNRQRRIISNILDVARLEKGVRIHSKRRFRLDILVKNVIEDFCYGADILDLHLDLNLKPITLSSDKEMLWHVFSNIISNSVKFRRPAAQLIISLGIEKKGKKAKVTITDNGIGLEKEELSRVFDKFYKTTSSVEGSGLGLSITRRIVEDLQGRIWLQSPGRNQGTTVFIEVPLY